MGNKLVRWLAAGICGMLAACAIITVNVYFPEKDVKQAYKSLDEMLLKQGGDDKTVPEKKEEVPPQSRLFDGRFSIAFVTPAYAQEKVADELAIEVSSMPEVLKAYDEMKARLPQLNALRESGAVGETSQGLVTIRDKKKAAGKESLVKDENDNRKAVITAMAAAILKINKQPITEAGKKQLLPKAAAIYADIKREEAKSGWWIQLANGRWVQK